jgi:nucleoside-diphosphate-sugar epimerase
VRILVTGATGFLGCHTVAALRGAGHDVRALARSRGRVGPALEPLGLEPGAVEVVVGDVTDRASVRAAVAGCDAVVHAASVYSLDPRRAGEIARVNAPGTEIVLRSAAEAGLDPVVHVSSFGALLPRTGDGPLRPDSSVGTSRHPYTGSKAASEAVARALQDEGAPVSITYPGMVWGPHDPHLGETSRLARELLAGRLPALPPGVVPVSDVRDVAAVHAALAEPGRGPRRHVAAGENVPVAEIARTAARLTGRRLPALVLPARAAAAAAALGDRLSRLGVGLLPAREAVWVASQDGSADAATTVRDLGVSFRPAAESIRDTIRWLHAAGHLSARRAGALAQAA